MVDSMKDPHPTHTISTDLKALISATRTRRTKVFAYGFVFAFVACTAFLAFNPSTNASSPWFYNLFSSSSTTSLKASIAPYRDHVSSLFSHFFPNSSSPAGDQAGGGDGPSKASILGSGSALSGAPTPNRTRTGNSGKVGVLGRNQTDGGGALEVKQQNVSAVPSKGSGVSGAKQGKKNGDLQIKNQTKSGSEVSSKENGVSAGVQTDGGGALEVKQQNVSAAPSKGSGVSEATQAKKNGDLQIKNQTKSGSEVSRKEKNQTKSGSEVSRKENGASASVQTDGVGASAVKQQNISPVPSKGSGTSEAKQGKKNEDLQMKNQTKSGSEVSSKVNGVSASAHKESKANSTRNGEKGIEQESRVTDLTKSSLATAKSSSSNTSNNNEKKKKKKREKWIEDMMGCDMFHGNWVKDESYPLYPEGSCPHIDEPFDCFLNGRPDRSYQKLRWQPMGCNIPRLNATDMLERLRGKRLVFVGDSLNRNMWESLVCVLRNSVKDKKKVFEASGRHEFRTEGSYSFLFKDYGATIEFFRSPFLVQEWEMPTGNGTKETLRLDIIERSSSKYKDAHVIVFNTGHWWTHEKTSKGKDYYQEGNRVYSELNVVEAFHKALNTWAKWVDANVNPKKTFVFFRGYSASHFSGGQWNSGGACDKETEPIKNEKYLSSYPPKMSVLESVIKGMKMPVSYLNITRMTDYRKDAHPSVYRKQNLTEEERKDPLRFQDCSHWCLPGVPDSWNELLYAQLIVKQYQMTQ